MDRDTMRPEYDFSEAVRGVTAARYAQGANIVVIDPEVLDVFPDGATVQQGITRSRAGPSAATWSRGEAAKRLTNQCTCRPELSGFMLSHVPLHFPSASFSHISFLRSNGTFFLTSYGLTGRYVLRDVAAFIAFCPCEPGGPTRPDTGHPAGPRRRSLGASC